MEAITTYFFRANVYLVIFAIGYLVLLKRDPLPVFNRFFILFSFVLSLLLAAIPPIPAAITGGHIILQEPSLVLPGLIIRAGNGSSLIVEILSGTFEKFARIHLVLILIPGVLVLSLFIRLIRIVFLIKAYPVRHKAEMRLVLLSNHHSPFSFFHYVFVPASMINQDRFSVVLAHEKAHCHCGHSWDMLFMEGMRILFWLNPLFYFFLKELREQHEYEADMLTCRFVAKEDYQLTLLEYTLSGTLVPLTNPFNVSPIKKRIIMMNHRTKKKMASSLMKVLLLLPLLLLVVAVQSCQDRAKKMLPEETTAEAVVSQAGENEEAVFTVVETPPVFPGGEESRVRFLQENLNYPPEARKAGVQGIVLVSFVVRADGSIDDIKVMQGAGHKFEEGYQGSAGELEMLRNASKKLDEEAVRVIESMPKWTPGYQLGEAVNVQFTMPIRFALN